MRRRSVLAPLTGEPPSEFKIFGMGPNPATDGIPAIVDVSDVDRIMSAFAKLGRPLAGKVEHKRGETACRFGLAAREDGIYAIDVDWTPDGSARWSGWQSSFVSPEFDADKRGHVSAIWGVGLTDDPASFNPVSVHQRSIQGMPLLSDALMAVAPKGAVACEPTTDGRVVYEIEHLPEGVDGPCMCIDCEGHQHVVFAYTLEADGTVKLEGRAVETTVMEIVVEPADDAPIVPVVTVSGDASPPERIEIERAVEPALERAMIDDTPILAKHPGGVISGVCVTMPDGQMMAVDLQGNPMPMPGMAAAAPAAPPTPEVSPAAPPPAQMDPAVMRAVVAEEIQRAISAMKEMNPAAVTAAKIESIVQPEKIEQPPSVYNRSDAKPGPREWSPRP